MYRILAANQPVKEVFILDVAVQLWVLRGAGLDVRDAGVREYQNPWGQSSRHRRLERPNADPERLFDFQTEDDFAV